jgi:predicted Zn-dependent protease
MGKRHGISRRHFIRHAAAGAASICLSGCATIPRRISVSSAPPQLQLTDRDAFRRLADAALGATSADHVLVSLHDRIEELTQVHDQTIDNAQDRSRRISIVVAYDQQVGSATAALTADAVADAVKTAEQQAKAALPDRGYLPPLPPQRYPVLPTYRPETAAAGGARRAAAGLELVELYRTAGLQASGIVTTAAEAVGLAADTGLFAFEQRTLAELDVTSINSVVPIRLTAANRSIDDLGLVEPTRRAVARAKWLANPRTLPPGRYTVIFEPPAAAQLLRPLLDATDAGNLSGSTGALQSMLGKQIVDSRLTLRNRPDHPALLGNGFDADGLPTNAQTWIDHGVLKQLHYDRLAARAHETAPTFTPDAWHLSGDNPAGESVEDLIRTTEQGILVTKLERLHCVGPTDLTLTGRTCDGTFLIQQGEIVGSLADLTWCESPLRAFNQVQAFSTPLDAVVLPHAVPAQAVTAGIRKMLVPAMKILDFNMVPRE